jgi:TRAP-type mannitol/chloroaromatic compound transport system substrate-binding protein
MAAPTVAKRVAEATGGKFQIQVFAAGEIVPGARRDGCRDKDGTVEMCHTCSYYFRRQGPHVRLRHRRAFRPQQPPANAWYRWQWRWSCSASSSRYNMYNIPAGNTGVQMGGWYRKEIKKVTDLQGLKMRIGGLAGQVLAKLGSVPQQIPGGDIYPSLEKGTIDAAEWIGPYDDQKLGFNKVAKYYYYPAWWEGGPQITTFISQKHWASLPKEYQAILELACADAHVEMMAQYDAKNPMALKQLVGAGTQLRPFPKEVLDACYKAANELYAEISAKNPAFKKVYDDFRKFQGDQNLWFRIAEGSYSNYMASAR